MEKRYTQPALLWALAQEYAAKKWPDKIIGHTDLQVAFYPVDGDGLWIMHSPKLYYQDEPGADHFTNCDQSALADHEIGEVVLSNRRNRQSAMLGATLEEAVSTLRDAPMGRPTKYEAPLSVRMELRLTQAMRDSLPADNSEALDTIRGMIEERMGK